MSADAKREYGSAVVLVILGMLVLYGGASWLLALIPAAILVWYAVAGPIFRRSRN